jgi:hypothetical protein
MAARAAPILAAAVATSSVVADAAETHAGGVTQATATGIAPIYDDRARSYGVVGAQGDGEGGGSFGPDLSRAARLGGPKQWNCPFPPGTTIDNTFVRVEADVMPDGRAVAVRVIDDKDDFAHAAISCAMKERYVEARNRRGQSVRAWSQPFRVVFTRW